MSEWRKTCNEIEAALENAPAGISANANYVRLAADHADQLARFVLLLADHSSVDFDRLWEESNAPDNT